MTYKQVITWWLSQAFQPSAGAFPGKDMELPDDCTVDWVLDHLKIPRQLGIIYLNGLAASAADTLRQETLYHISDGGGGY